LLLRLSVDADVELARGGLEEALEHVGDDLRLRAEVLLGMSACVMDVGASEQLAREAMMIAEEVGDGRLLATALGAVGRRAARAGHPEPALVEQGVALAEMHGTIRGWPTPRMVFGVSSLRKGDLSGARELLEAEIATILQEGREYDRATVLTALADLEWRAGRWDRVGRYLEDLDEFAAAGDEWSAAFCLVAKGRLAGARGSLDAARRLLTEAQRVGEANHAPIPAAAWALRALALALGELTAVGDLTDVERVPDLLRFHMERPDALADIVEALVALGRLQDAGKVLVTVDEEARNGQLWAAPAVLRCRALILLGRGDAAPAVVAAEEAATGFEILGFPLDHGRALLVAGGALRRLGQRRQAGDKVEAARAVFVKLGATLWAERAEKELRRARPRPRRDGELTSAERRVAALVVEGRTNREVAAQLFTTVATVEAHLTRIYRKLGVRSRTELARRVADRALSVVDE
jgi:DNA-binding CsgD family transcriptional regulator